MILSCFLSPAIESGPGIRPGDIGGHHASRGEAEISPGWPCGVMVLEGGGLFYATGLHPAQSLQIGEVDDERVVAAGAGLIRQAGQVSIIEFLDILRANKALLQLCLVLFMPGCSVQGSRSEDSLLVVVKDIRLRSPNAGVNNRSSIWAPAHEELSYEQAAPEGTDKSTPPRP